MQSQRRQIAELAVKNRLPAIYSQTEFTEAGGLMYYGANTPDKISPGPELDALTAQKVFGWKNVHKHDGVLVGKKQDKAGRWRTAKVPYSFLLPNPHISCLMAVLVLCLNLGRTYSFHCRRKSKRTSK